MLSRLGTTRGHAALGLALALVAAAPAAAQEPTRTLQLLDNGDFAAPPPAEDERRVPWWVLGPDAAWREDEADGLLATTGPAGAAQPVALYAPLAGRLRLVADVRGAGRLTLTDGEGRRLVLELPEGGALDWAVGALREELGPHVRVALDELAGAAPTPRVTIGLSSAAPGALAEWRHVEALTELPAPTEEALRAELVGHLRRVFALWLERGVDREGPLATGFLCHGFDVVTGERLLTVPGGAHPFFRLLLRANSVAPRPEWEAALEGFAARWLELCFHPATGLPRTWDTLRDAPFDERPREIHFDLGLLLDLAADGPVAYRERMLAQARRIGEHVLARGALPDGAVAPGYFPASGAPHVDYPPLRRLDVPAQLARLAAATGDERYVAAAHDAVVAFEFTHAWPGTWDAIDPGFDDDYGHYGARAATMWEAWPDEPAFRRVAWDGYRHYAPIWRDALRFGGNVAADQVRCWRILREVAQLEPAALPEVRELHAAAVRAHFKGEQYGNGAWGDVTFYRFDPKADLEVGDVPGAPQNLLLGLAVVHGCATPARREDLRAMFTAVMRSSFAAYGREYGVLSTRAERQGRNPSRGSLNLAAGLVEMLEQLGSR